MHCFMMDCIQDDWSASTERSLWLVNAGSPADIPIVPQSHGLLLYGSLLNTLSGLLQPKLAQGGVLYGSVRHSDMRHQIPA